MKTIVVSFLSVGLVVVLAGPSDAASKKRYRTYYYGGLSQAYPPQPKAARPKRTTS
jgi:hypothetical protein